MRSVNNLIGFLFGLAFAALLFLAMAPRAHSEEEGQPDLGRLPTTDQTVLITRHGKDLDAQIVKVGQVEGGKAIVCFRDPSMDKPLVSCFVANTETGEVKILRLPINTTIL